MARPDSEVYTLLVDVGRKPGDGLPDESTGARVLCYAVGVDEEEAVRETVAVLKAADLAPLDVTGFGSLDERQDSGGVEPEELELMERARSDNAVIVAEVTPVFG